MGDRQLSIHNGDILSLTADAIVCPVNPALDLKSGLALTIGKAAGSHAHKERPLSPEPYGKVVVLPGGKLNVKYLFLAVLLGERGVDKMKMSIRQSVERSIRYAEFLRLKSIAFPVLGCAQTQPAYDFIAHEMLEQVALYFRKRNTKLKAILLSAFNPAAFSALRTEAQNLADL